MGVPLLLLQALKNFSSDPPQTVAELLGLVEKRVVRCPEAGSSGRAPFLATNTLEILVTLYRPAAPLHPGLPPSRELHSRPYTIHPTPYTLNHPPYIRHPTPYTLRPTLL